LSSAAKILFLSLLVTAKYLIKFGGPKRNKCLIMKKHLLLLFAPLLCITLKANAQTNNNNTGDNFSSLIKSAPGDATKLINAYGQPLFKGIGAGMNSGWNNTAKTKKLFHFDLRISATGALAPSADKTLDVTKLGLVNVRPADPNQTITPTIVGAKTQGPALDIYSNGKQVDEFNMPKGALSVVPSPQIQLTVGLLKNTDVTIRGVPNISFGNSGSISMIGFGVKHDIIQDFATAKRPIPFDLAIAFGYSSLKTNIGLTVTDNGAEPKDSQQSTDFSNQHVQAKFSSFMVQAIISKRILFFTPFLSVGYNTASVNLATIGNYPVTTGANLLGTPTYTTFTDPVKIQSTPLSAMRADLGFQLNLGFFRFYTSYGVTSSYQAGNVGIGFGF
jgi:hypothetical protein